MHVGAVFWIFPQCMVAGLLGTPNAGRNLFLSNVFAHFRKILMQIMKIKQFLGLIPKSWLTQITWSSTLENWQKHAFCENWQKHAFCIYVWIFWKWNFFKVMKNIFLPVLKGARQVFLGRPALGNNPSSYSCCLLSLHFCIKNLVKMC